MSPRHARPEPPDEGNPAPQEMAATPEPLPTFEPEPIPTFEPEPLPKPASPAIPSAPVPIHPEPLAPPSTPIAAQSPPSPPSSGFGRFSPAAPPAPYVSSEPSSGQSPSQSSNQDAGQAEELSDSPVPTPILADPSGGDEEPPVHGHRRLLLIVLIGLLAVLAAGIAALLLTQSPADPAPGPAPSPSATGFDVQRTMLIQVRNENELGAANMVAGVGGTYPPAQVLVPSRLIVDVPGAGQQTLGQSARLLDRSASQDALSDLLALRMDGTFSLGRLALAGMVDYVGGISVNVDKEVTAKDPKTGDEVVVVPVGTVHLNGTQAATYALAWLPEEPEAARLARFSDVITQTVSGLPDDTQRVEAMLTSLGGSARTTTSTSSVAEYLVRMRTEILAGGQQIRVLPTTDIESGGSLPVVRVDLVNADVMLGKLLPGAQITGAQYRPRVLVQNGVGTPGLGASARDKLVAAKLVYVNGGNAGQFGVKKSVIIVGDDSAKARELGTQIATALGLPVTAIEIATSGQNVADAVVVLGSDFTS